MLSRVFDALKELLRFGEFFPFYPSGKGFGHDFFQSEHPPAKQGIYTYNNEMT